MVTPPYGIILNQLGDSMRNVISYVILIILAFFLFLPQPAMAKVREKVKVSVLLKDANEIMTEAQETYVDGDATKAIELYRKALVEIIKIERKYPDRVRSSGFAPLRFRRALCETEVDRIMLEEVNASARSVAVTDTRELELKRRERQQEFATNKLAKVSKKLSPKGGTGLVDDNLSYLEDATAAKLTNSVKNSDSSIVQIPDLDLEAEMEWARDMYSAGKYDQVLKSLIKVLRRAPEKFDARYLMALTRMHQSMFVDAQILVDDLLTDYGRNESVLLLAAGVYTATQQYSKAMSTLDKALKISPKRPDGYINMAWLLLEMNPGQLSDPEMYYRRAVELGGKRDSKLEKQLGIRQ